MVRKNAFIQEIDKIIGKKIYSLRLSQGFSRQQLSDIIQVTHQQLQKYEKGTNRISVGRLVLIAKALNQDVSYFYNDIATAKSEKIDTTHQRMCIEVSRNFMKIKNEKYQSAVNDIVKSLVKLNNQH
ncbi:MAG: helix-turn-helix transcriptional regulator [Rickettsia sp.]|nr:helix-turn-helix transcriptional regulator [Rickettsia sp.]